MDSLLVDLDKVLDEFEAEENSAPGSEIKPSGFQEYLEQSNQQTWNTLEDAMAPVVGKPYPTGIYKDGVAQDIVSSYPPESVRYDFPYEPEKFDLSEADFGAAPTLGDSGYNGSLSYATPSTHVTSNNTPDSRKPVENGFNSQQDVPGTPYENVKPTFPTFASQKSDAGKITPTLQINYDKMPIEADLSPTMEHPNLSFQQNGHSMGIENFKNGINVNEKPVIQTQLSSIPSLSSMTSNNSDTDKYPVQCNTPQTPKENPFANPLVTQLSLTNGNVTANGLSETSENSSETVRSGQDTNVVQNGIPKLENLKQDLEKNVGISPKNVASKNMKNFSQSLPASLHQNWVQNGGNSSNSLPMELDDKSHVGNTKTETKMEVVTSQQNQSLQNHVPTDMGNANQANVHVGSIANKQMPVSMETKTEQYDHVSNESVMMNEKFQKPMSYADKEASVSAGHVTTDSVVANVSSFQPQTKYDQEVVTPVSFDKVMQSEPVQQPQSDFQKEAVVGFGNFEDDIRMDESDLNAYLDDHTENKVHFAPKQVNIDNQRPQFDNQMGIPGKDNWNKMETSEDTNVATNMENIGQLASDQRCNTNVNPKDNMVVPELGKAGLDLSLQNKSEQFSNVDQNSDLEILKVLSDTSVQNSTIVSSQPVITDLKNGNTALSPNANLSLDSGCASMPDHVTDDSPNLSGGVNVTENKIAEAGARPKDINNKVNRPNSLIGLSTVDLNSESPFVAKPLVSPSVERNGELDPSVQTMHQQPPQYVEKLVSEYSVSEMMESRQYMDTGPGSSNEILANIEKAYSESEQTIPTGQNIAEGQQLVSVDDQHSLDQNSDLNSVELRNPHGTQGGDYETTAGRPHSWGPGDTSQPAMVKQKRPTSLNLPPPRTIDPADPEGEDERQEGQGQEREGEVNMDTEAGVDAENLPPYQVLDDGTLPEGAHGGSDQPYIPPDQHMDLGPPPPYTSSLGMVAPKWIPDAEAPVCMSCEARFTFTKRRHHCRACGRVFCSSCCSMKNRLPYMKNQEARVCVMCHSQLAIAEQEGGDPYGGYPHPNNPSDYCSVVPPQQAAGATAAAPPPSVLVPVLKRDGSNRRSEPKQVMFSDGIRPGGDLTELDGSSEMSRVTPRRSSRAQKRATAQGTGQHSQRSRRLRTVTERTTKCLIPEDGLPPLTVLQPDGQGNTLQVNPNPNDFMSNIKAEDKEPVIFAVNTNLYVHVKIVTLDCCVNRTVWCFTTWGMTSVGQEEIALVLETLPDENTPPRDIFTHLNNVYEDASKGNVITEMGHSIFNQSFLDSRDHGGFLYIRASFQCVQKLTLPNPPFLFAILLQKWETPWAKVFPLRLLLRLGAEYRYYPCPLIGNRNRKPVFYEIGHTIMNLLADFRNYQYMLPNIRGITIHMEDKVTKINFPRNRYEDLMKVVNNSNEHVMAIGATFSSEADSHLVCIQNEDGNYQTQAINIQNKPRKVTGASFVVFNGALKTSSGLTAKSSIVEDGLMVQIMPDSMLALKQAIRDMHDYPINCGVLGAQKPDETVIVQWVDDDKNVNIGVKSPVDNMVMDGVESLRIQSSTDHVGERHIIRWTEIFFIQNEERGSPKWDPVDLSRIGETVATACCLAMTQHLDKLKEAGLDKIGLRITLGNDNVGYEAGAKGERLPDIYMNDLDNELIPVIHRATQPDTQIVLELIFEVLE